MTMTMEMKSVIITLTVIIPILAILLIIGAVPTYWTTVKFWFTTAVIVYNVFNSLHFFAEYAIYSRSKTK